MKRVVKVETAEDIIYKIHKFMGSFSDQAFPGALMPIKAWIDSYYNSPSLPKTVLNQHVKDCNKRMKKIIKKRGIDIKL